MTADPTAQHERAQERFAHVDDPDCPECGEVVRLGHSCDGCGWHEGQYLDDTDDAVDAIREARA